MHKQIKSILSVSSIFLSLFLFSQTASATHNCFVGASGYTFCRYSGVVRQIQVNPHNKIGLIRFDEAIPLNTNNFAEYEQKYGSITNRSWVAVDLQTEQGRLALGLAVNSKTLGKSISVHMSGKISAFMRLVSITQH